MGRAHHAANAPWISRQYWSSYDAVDRTLATSVAPGDIVRIQTTRPEIGGGWAWNTGNFGGREVAVPLEGWYQVGAQLTATHGSEITSVQCQIEGAVYVNGVIRGETSMWATSVSIGGSEFNSAAWTGPMYLGEGDELQLRAWSLTPTGPNFSGTKGGGCGLTLTYIDR